MSDEILKRVDALAAKLGVAANHIWAILVRQARVEAVTDLISMVIALVIAVAAAYGMRWLYKTEDLDDAGVPFTGCIVIGVGAIFVAVGFAMASVTELLNPEYFALQQILQAK